VNKDEALTIIKEMLCRENSYRLGQEYQAEYAKSEDNDWISSVTERLQSRVVTEFMEKGKSIFTTLEEGLSFLRGAVGNFPDHLEELKSCANYVRFTQNCRRGHLKVGDIVDGSDILLYHPGNLTSRPFSSYLQSSRPLVVIASSYT